MKELRVLNTAPTPCMSDVVQGKTPRPADPTCPCVTSGYSQVIADLASGKDGDWEAVKRGAQSIPQGAKDRIRNICTLP